MKGAILNVNGIIVNTDQQEFEAWQQLAMYEYGMGLPGKLAADFKGLSQGAALDKVLARFNATADEGERVELLAQQDKFYQQALEKIDKEALVPGIERLIVNLYDHYVDIVVNDEDGHADEIIKKTKLDGFVNLVAHPAAGVNPYEDLAKQLGQEPAGCIGLGTNAAAIDQMNAVGVTSIGIGDATVLKDAAYQVTLVGDLRYQMLEKVWEDQK